MELKAALVGNAPLRRGFRFFKCLNQKKSATIHVLEAMVSKANGSGGSLGVVSCAEEDGGVVRMKILVKKRDLNQLVEVMRGGVKGVAHKPTIMPYMNVPSSTAEQRLNNLLWKKHLSRAKPLKGNSKKCWSPVLQSIPEEL